MTGLGITGNIVAILVLLLVIGMAHILLRHRFDDQRVTWQRRRADKGKVKCYHGNAGGTSKCKNKAGWVTPHGYYCDEHWEINSTRTAVVGKVRWANKLAWKRTEQTDVWTT